MCSESVDSEKKRLHVVIAANGYPESVTNKCLLRKTKPPKPQGEEEVGCEILCLPYIKGLRENMKEQSEI